MTYKSPYGKAEGLADRLEQWAERMSMDKTLPWAGLGIIMDLRAATAALRGEPLPDPDAEEMDYDL
jgi:hypothetical protein